ncbi:hypothetical protein DPMN_137623, partial [Dreissena polymorpha]
MESSTFMMTDFAISGHRFPWYLLVSNLALVPHPAGSSRGKAYPHTLLRSALEDMGDVGKCSDSEKNLALAKDGLKIGPRLDSEKRELDDRGIDSVNLMNDFCSVEFSNTFVFPKKSIDPSLTPLWSRGLQLDHPLSQQQESSELIGWDQNPIANRCLYKCS